MVQKYRRGFSVAARNWDADAQYQFGEMYRAGYTVKQDQREANRWFIRSAEANNPKALLFMGTAYYFALGVNKDVMESYKWFAMASFSKHPKARNYMVAAAKTMTKRQIKAASALARSKWRLNSIKAIERRNKANADMAAKFETSRGNANRYSAQNVQSAPKATSKSSGSGGIKARLMKLKELEAAGLISKKEAAQKRKAILDSL